MWLWICLLILGLRISISFYISILEDLYMYPYLNKSMYGGLHKWGYPTMYVLTDLHLETIFPNFWSQHLETPKFQFPSVDLSLKKQNPTLRNAFNT